MNAAIKAGLGVVAIGVFSALLSALPKASDYPFPYEEVSLGVNTLTSWLTAFNLILPVDTFLTCVVFAFAIKFAVRYMYPMLLWLFHKFWQFVSGN